MPNKPPVALILFSNDMDNFLPNVERERKMIEEALEHFDDSNRLSVKAHSSVGVEELFRLFNRYKGRIALFHFAGHAGGTGLQFNDKNAEGSEVGRAEGIADLLKQEVEKGILQLVFLNGCRTEPQLKLLQAAGVPSVISTYYPIEDNKAVAFAKVFYQYLTNKEAENPFEKLPTIGEAFKHAKSYLRTTYKAEEAENHRDFMINLSGDDKQEAWTLYSENEDWNLSAITADEEKVFNLRLTQELLDTLDIRAEDEPGPDDASLAELLKEIRPDGIWDEKAGSINTGKAELTSRFVGVIGKQLRKIFAIGASLQADYEMKDKGEVKNYIQNCNLTCKRALQLLCYYLISNLWDFLSQEADNLSEEQRKGFEPFFTRKTNLSIKGYFQLLKLLMELYVQYPKLGESLGAPENRTEDFASQVKEDGLFQHACDNLDELQELIDTEKFERIDCFKAERNLATVLSTCWFLTKYQMVSIKEIVYEQVRNASPAYLHKFALINLATREVTSSKPIDSRDPGQHSGYDIYYKDKPNHTDAVLLTRKGTAKSINLFPFVIDYNALTFKNGSKIYFYEGKENDTTLRYSSLDDGKEILIKYTGVLQEGDKLNELFRDNEKRKAYNEKKQDYKYDAVFLQFISAFKTFLPQEEKSKERITDNDAPF